MKAPLSDKGQVVVGKIQDPEHGGIPDDWKDKVNLPMPIVQICLGFQKRPSTPFIENQCLFVVQTIKSDQLGSHLTLRGLDFDSEKSGYIAMAFENKDRRIHEIGISFGARVNGSALMERGFDPSNWIPRPYEGSRSGIIVQTFDDAWRLICLVADALEVSGISISYSG